MARDKKAHQEKHSRSEYGKNKPAQWLAARVEAYASMCRSNPSGAKGYTKPGSLKKLD